MSKLWTVIIKAENGGFHVGTTDDVQNYMKECKKKYHAGYFTHKKMRGKWTLMFRVKGDYKRNICMFGIENFLKLVRDYDPILDGIDQILSS